MSDDTAQQLRELRLFWRRVGWIASMAFSAWLGWTLGARW